jgi:hypothetical protein
MIKLSLVSLGLFASTSAFAQAPVAALPAAAPPVAAPASAPAADTLVSHAEPLRFTGWYLAPTAGFSSFNGRLAYLPGLRGAIMLNRKFGLGFAGSLVGTDRTRLRDDDVRHIGAYGGSYAQYILRSSSLVHAYADATLGSGAWCEQSVNDECDERRFGFIEPTLNVELNLAKNVRLATGLGYRLAIAGERDGHSRTSMSGVVARTSLVLGVF